MDLSAEQYELAVLAATRAPSVHNTQPWTFHLDGSVVEVRADRSRSLPVEDPLGRELLLSCGAAVRHLFLGLRVAGRDVACEQLPEAKDPDLVARLRVGAERPPTLPESDLFAALWTRHTDRAPFSPGPVPSHVVDQLLRVTLAEGCQLEVLDAESTLTLAVLGHRAEQLLERDPERRDEQQRWTAPVPDPREGVPAGEGDVRGMNVPMRRFAASTRTTSEPPAVERPLLLVLSTVGDHPRDWLDAGWTLADLLLLLEHHGLAASPLTQVLEVSGLRAQLRGALALQGHPQVVLRVGLPGIDDGTRTRRRPLTEVMV